MEDDDRQYHHSSPTGSGPVLPGLGIVIGMFASIFAWVLVVDDLVELGPVGSWLAQGLFFAGCIVIASAIDGLIRPNAMKWPFRIRVTLSIALGIIIVWGVAAVGYAVAGKTGGYISWLSALAFCFVFEWFYRRERRQME
jgi:hypothetical protein